MVWETHLAGNLLDGLFAQCLKKGENVDVAKRKKRQKNQMKRSKQMHKT